MEENDFEKFETVGDLIDFLESEYGRDASLSAEYVHIVGSQLDGYKVRPILKKCFSRNSDGRVILNAMLYK